MANKETRKEILGLSRITKKRIRELCRKDKLYQTPELNDVLYLHYQGFECIECLDEYTELKCLWLECNAISEIQGLNKQTKLKCLFLHSNLIRKIENLEYCRDLDTLNLSQNHIRKIENCGYEVLPVLNTLNLAANYLKDFESLKELENCKNLSVLDLSNNRVDDILVVKIFSQMPELKVLVLQGNPVVSKIPQYRKTLTLECKKLTYLDSRPVFPKDRACAEAWKRGGYAEERKENERWSRRERKKIKDGVNATIHLRNKHRKLEDKIPLIPSSDSEDDIKPQKRKIKIHLDSDVSMDSIWDEVSEDLQENKCINSINDNSDQSSDSISECSGDKETNDSINIEGDSIAIINQHQIHKENRIMEVNREDLEFEKENKENEGNFLQTFSEEYQKSEDLEAEKEHSEQNEYSFETSNEKFNVVMNHEPKLQSNDSHHNKESRELENLTASKDATVTEQTESDYEENYASTIEAIRQISESLDLPANSNKLTEKINSREENVEEYYEPLKELEEKMNELLKESESKTNFYRFKKIEEKSRQKLENDKQSLEVNSQLKSDFEELFTNMSKFLNTLEKEQEERKEVQNALFCSEKAAKYSSRETTDNEDEDTRVKPQIERLVDAWDNETKLKVKNERDERNRHNTEFINAAEKTTRGTEADNYVELEDNETKSSPNLEYDATDISLLTRKSNEALNALEKSSKELKILLQKLENRNEELFKDFNPKEKNEKDESYRDLEPSLKITGKEFEAIPNQNNEDEQKNNGSNCEPYSFKNGETELEEAQYIAAELVQEILQSLESTYSKPRSYQIPYEVPQSNEDLNFSMIERQPEQRSKSMPQVIESFNQLFKKMEAEQRRNPKNSLENLDEQKSLILKELSLKSNLKQFNNDTRESLDAQLEEIRKNQRKKVRRIVNRVYAQKDRYKDTIELVDGQLMVLNHETQEMQELPKPLQYETSDSEGSYDTALSEDEDRTEEEFRSYKSLWQKYSRNNVLRGSSKNAQVISNDESDESSDEFYSLDAQNKPNLYAIDKELIKNLNFDFSNLTQQDENHIVQCARSYEELKHCLTLDREKVGFTEQENKLLENMTETKNKTLQSNKEEQLWFNKSLMLEDHHQTSEFEKPFEKIITNRSLRDFLNEPQNDDSLCEVKSPEIFAIAEQQSEEEKNEIENNFDIENEIAFSKTFDCNERDETSKDNLENNEEKKNEPTIKMPAENSTNVEIIECNLEIISDNNEVVDTITVNAELHF